MGWFGYLTLFLYPVYFLYETYKVEVKLGDNTYACDENSPWTMNSCDNISTASVAYTDYQKHQI